MTPCRLYADDYEQASAQAWDKHPNALGVIIKYLYCGWYECVVLLAEGR